MIKTSGANVAPIEDEEVLDAHPDVKRAAVIGVPDAVAGELVIGCVVRRDEAAVEEDVLLAHVPGVLRRATRCPAASSSSTRTRWR